MNRTAYPLALIVLALCASQADASPRIEGAPRYGLNDAARFRDALEVKKPAAAPAAADVDDEAMPCDASAPCCVEQALVQDLEDALAVAPAALAPAPESAVAEPAMLARALAAIRSAIVIPLRYGVAVFGASNEAPPKPPVKAKPRMLTLF
jgi:hypothetical protein